jgi:hypothetical protein
MTISPSSQAAKAPDAEAVKAIAVTAAVISFI